MSFLSIFKTLFSHVGKAIVQALGFATTHGLTDAVLDAAIEFVKQAATTVLNNDEKRQYVVERLSTRFNIPTSIAGLATELAVQAAKAEIAKYSFDLRNIPSWLSEPEPPSAAPAPAAEPTGKKTKK